jgi:fatty acid desaturase
MRTYYATLAIIAAIALWTGGVWLLAGLVVFYVVIFIGTYFYLIHTPQDPSNPHRRVREGWWS